MKSKKLIFAIAVALAALPLVSFAQEAVAEEETSSAFAWTGTVTSDYVWRGITQTDEGVAFQTGLTYTAPVGIYAGVWASNVDFGSDANFEVDGFVGYNTDFGDNVNFDVMLNRYTYTGESALNWNELIAKATFLENYSVTVAYSNDSWATGENGLYYALGTSWDLPSDFSVSASVGYTDFSKRITNEEDGLRDYGDWSVGVGKTIGPMSLGLAYIGINDSGRKVAGYQADDRLVFSITVAAP